mgnify:CR=1 FL=1
MPADVWSLGLVFAQLFAPAHPMPAPVVGLASLDALGEQIITSSEGTINSAGVVDEVAVALDSSDGSLLLIVRPVRPDTALPPDVSMEASAGKTARKPCGTCRRTACVRYSTATSERAMP